MTRNNFTDSGLAVFRELYTIYNNWHWPHSVRFIGVWVSVLTVKESLSLPLFESDIKQAKIWQAMDSINRAFGEYTVYPAVMLQQNILHSEVNGYTKL